MSKNKRETFVMRIFDALSQYKVSHVIDKGAYIMPLPLPFHWSMSAVFALS